MHSATFEVSPYLNYISNYIYGFLTGDTIQGFPVRHFTASDARLVGFEASAAVTPVPYLALLASSDYVNAENTQLNVPLPFIPPLRGLLRATYQDQKYMGMIEWRAAASQTRLGVGDTPTAGWAIFNFGAGIRFTQKDLVHNISIHHRQRVQPGLSGQPVGDQRLRAATWAGYSAELRAPLLNGRSPRCWRAAPNGSTR